jgi:hypothetical protein
MGTMNASQLQVAFAELDRELGILLPQGARLSVEIVGTAAAHLQGFLAREPNDCDVGSVSPVEHEDDLLDAAAAVVRKLGLQGNWLNTESVIWLDYWPEGWQTRLVDYGSFTHFDARLMARRDLIACKALSPAVRSEPSKADQDMSDLEAMQPTAVELDGAIAHIEDLIATAEEAGDDPDCLYRAKCATEALRQQM